MSTGLKVPFTYRPAGGCATVEGDEFTQAQIRQVLSVRATDESGAQNGEYFWRTELGNLFNLARHHPEEVLADLLAVFAEDVFTRFVPGAIVTGAETERLSKMKYRCSLGWDTATSSFISTLELIR